MDKRCPHCKAKHFALDALGEGICLNGHRFNINRDPVKPVILPPEDGKHFLTKANLIIINAIRTNEREGLTVQELHDLTNLSPEKIRQFMRLLISLKLANKDTVPFRFPDLPAIYVEI